MRTVGFFCTALQYRNNPAHGFILDDIPLVITVTSALPSSLLEGGQLVDEYNMRFRILAVYGTYLQSLKTLHE
jgi:hypothetical protein